MGSLVEDQKRKLINKYLTLFNGDVDKVLSWEMDKIRSKAHSLVYAAKVRGDLPFLNGKIKCVDCNGIAKVYDHRDYRTPLKVDPVCKPCNAQRGNSVDFVEMKIKFLRDNFKITDRDIKKLKYKPCSKCGR